MQVTLLLGISIIVVLSILTYNVYSLRQFFQKALQDLSPTKSLQDSSKIENELKEIQEFLFFQKYANIPFTPFRTVTLSNAILQSQNSNSDTMPDSYEIKDNSSEAKATRLNRLGKEEVPTNRNADSSQPSSDLNNLDEYKKDIEVYELHVNAILGGSNKLGEMCLCPNDKPCNWRPKMFFQFMYNTELFDLKSIEIFKIDDDPNNPISKIQTTEFLEGGIYAFVTMSNQEVINQIQPEENIHVVIKWNDKNGVLQMATLRNVLEADPA